MPLPSNCENSLQRQLTMIRMADLANEQFSAALEGGKIAVESGRIDPEQAEIALNELEQKLSA